MTTIGLFGGVYGNVHALEAVYEHSRMRRDQNLWCLGDVGGFCAAPDECAWILRKMGIPTLQGNYDHSIGNGLDDCACGYTDPRDNEFARISYQYTRDQVSDDARFWMGELEPQARFEVHGRRVLLCHGSPRRVNEFLWDSTCSDAFLEWLCDEYEADVIACSHTGLYWHRALSRGRHFVNVGAIGRPAHDGRTCVWYAGLTIHEDGGVEVAFRDVNYDHEAAARLMEREELPPEFIETIRTGWWTTCLENVPVKERMRRGLLQTGLVV